MSVCTSRNWLGLCLGEGVTGWRTKSSWCIWLRLNTKENAVFVYLPGQIWTVTNLTPITSESVKLLCFCLSSFVFSTLFSSYSLLYPGVVMWVSCLYIETTILRYCRMVTSPIVSFRYPCYMTLRYRALVLCFGLSYDCLHLSWFVALYARLSI